MSSKHIYTSANGLVDKYLKGLVRWNPSLSLIPSDKVVYDTRFSPEKVAIISGGGAGHEPAWCGYVGENMLASAASGDIFASPSARQVESAIKSVLSDKGTILLVTNYTGDCLNFGLACEKVNAASYRKGPVAVINCGDDVSVGKKGNGLVGRRGLPGQLLVVKILGAAAGNGSSFEEVLSLGDAVKDQLVSIAATLDHCHVPGRAEHAQLDSTTIEVGTGPHNEPGFKKLNPQPSAKDLVSILTAYLTDEADPLRYYVKFAEGDEVVVLVNNFGGMSPLEMGALTAEFLEHIPSHLHAVRVYTGVFESSLNAPAFALTLFNLTAAAKTAGVKPSMLLKYLDTKTDSAWEAVAGSQAVQRPSTVQIVESPLTDTVKLPVIRSLIVESKILETVIRKACKRVIEAEPDLTKWDTIMGDGDCGETFQTGAQEMLKLVDRGLTAKGSILDVISAISNITETKMGGTLGAILGIFFNSLVAELVGGASIYEAPARACRNLQHHTAARVGHRTIMDVLIPTTETLEKSSDVEKMFEAAKNGAESTKALIPALGRATYVGLVDGQELPPDPGAWGAMEAVRGIYEALYTDCTFAS